MEEITAPCITPKISLEKHFTTVMQECAKRHTESITNMEQRQLDKWEAQEKALVLARNEAEKQYHALNNLRKEYMEERSLFLLESVYDSKHEVLTTRINTINDRVAEITNWFKVWGAVVLALSLAFQLAAHYIFK